MDEGRPLVGFALLDADTVIEAHSWPAPAATDERMLAELHRHAVDLLQHHAPVLLALRECDPQVRRTNARAPRAEGVLMGAAGLAGVPIWTVTGLGLRTPAGLRGKGATVRAAVASLGAQLRNCPPEIERREAACAALVAAQSAGRV